MIIDSHAHHWPSDDYVHCKHAWEMFIKLLIDTYYRPVGVEINEEELRGIYFDPDGSKLIRRMDEAGVDKTIILPVDWDKVNGEAERDIIEQNRVYAEFAKKHPDRIIAFFSIEPEKDNAAEAFRTAVDEWGLRGLKLYPPTGFYPDDQACIPLYEICLERGLPVIFHGALSPMSKKQYCHPDDFKRLAEKYPELKIVIAHSGGLDWINEAVKVYLEHENVYMDISGFQGGGDMDMFRTSLDYLLYMAGTFERIMFGTDSPIFNGVCEVKDMVRAIRESNLPEDEKTLLLGGAAEKMLGL